MRGAGGGADPDARLGWRWDVALSFAGTQRAYVEQVAEALKARGARCFNDADEQIEGTDHGMFVPGHVSESAAALGQVRTTVENFLGHQVWPQSNEQGSG